MSRELGGSAFATILSVEETANFWEEVRVAISTGVYPRFKNKVRKNFDYAVLRRMKEVLRFTHSNLTF